jgi:hypothetical protein
LLCIDPTVDSATFERLDALVSQLNVADHEKRDLMRLVTELVKEARAVASAEPDVALLDNLVSSDAVEPPRKKRRMGDPKDDSELA